MWNGANWQEFHPGFGTHTLDDTWLFKRVPDGN